MTPQQLATLHAAAFFPERGWSPGEIQSLCASSLVHCHAEAHGFALVRTIADETELLTLAVDPAFQRRGIADTLMRTWLETSTAERAFLEVAADNAPARALYAKYGFAETGRRKRYYPRASGKAVDAVLMQAAVTNRQTHESKVTKLKTG